MNSPLTRLVQDNCNNFTDAGAELAALAALLDLNTLNLTIGYREIIFLIVSDSSCVCKEVYGGIMKIRRLSRDQCCDVSEWDWNHDPPSSKHS